MSLYFSNLLFPELTGQRDREQERRRKRDRGLSRETYKSRGGLRPGFRTRDALHHPAGLPASLHTKSLPRLPAGQEEIPLVSFQPASCPDPGALR